MAKNKILTIIFSLLTFGAAFAGFLSVFSMI